MTRPLPDAAAPQLVRGTASGDQTIMPTASPTLLDDGEAGGTFHFVFNALVGDVNGDGVMNTGDVSTTRAALTSPLNAPLAPGSSNDRPDIDGLNRLDSAHLSRTRARLTSALGTTLASLPSPTAPTVGGNLQVAAVPEPATAAMALAGLASGGFSIWRRWKRA